MPANDQIMMGSAIALLSLLGLFKLNWLLNKAPKGKKLVSRYGEPKAKLIICSILSIALLFGILLAIGQINHVQWE